MLGRTWQGLHTGFAEAETHLSVIVQLIENLHLECAVLEQGSAGSAALLSISKGVRVLKFLQLVQQQDTICSTALITTEQCNEQLVCQLQVSHFKFLSGGNIVMAIFSVIGGAL